jgi:hypothetical protein
MTPVAGFPGFFNTLVILLAAFTVVLLVVANVRAHRRRVAAGGPAGMGLGGCAAVIGLAFGLVFLVLGLSYTTLHESELEPEPEHSVLEVDDGLEAWRRADVLETEGEAKPWLADAAGSAPWSEERHGLSVRVRRPGARGELVGYSGLHADLDAAVADARRAAVAQLRAHVIWELAKGGGGRLPLRVAPALELAEAAIGDEFESLALDRAHEEVKLRSSPLVLHRAAVLVRADRGTVAALAARVSAAAGERHAEKRAERKDLVLTLASAAGLALVVLLLYFFLNAGTKGHFAWPLRILSLGALAVVFLGILYLKGWLPTG